MNTNLYTKCIYYAYVCTFTYIHKYVFIYVYIHVRTSQEGYAKGVADKNSCVSVYI